MKNAPEMLADHVSTYGVLWISCFSRPAAIALSSGIKSVINCDCVSVASSNVTSRQKVEGPVLAAVGCLKLVPQAELPLVFQLQPDDGLAQGTSILADHAEGGACGCDRSKNNAPPKKQIKGRKKSEVHNNMENSGIKCFRTDESPFWKWNFLRNPETTKESQRYRRRPLNTRPSWFRLVECGRELM